MTRGIDRELKRAATSEMYQFIPNNSARTVVKLDPLDIKLYGLTAKINLEHELTVIFPLGDPQMTQPSESRVILLHGSRAATARRSSGWAGTQGIGIHSGVQTVQTSTDWDVEIPVKRRRQFDKATISIDRLAYDISIYPWLLCDRSRCAPLEAPTYRLSDNSAPTLLLINHRPTF